MQATNHERLPKVLHNSPKDSEMSDVAMPDAVLARNIIVDTFTGTRSRVIAAAYEAVKTVERKLPPSVLARRPRAWTERRVRSIVDAEATRIDHYEIDDLRKAAIDEARKELQRSRERAARMAAYLAATDQDFHGDEIERMGAFARGVDLPGVVRGGKGG